MTRQIEATGVLFWLFSYQGSFPINIEEGASLLFCMRSGAAEGALRLPPLLRAFRRSAAGGSPQPSASLCSVPIRLRRLFDLPRRLGLPADCYVV